MKITKKFILGMLVTNTAVADENQAISIALSCYRNQDNQLRFCHITEQTSPGLTDTFIISKDKLIFPDGRQYFIPKDAIELIDSYLNNNGVPQEDLLILAGTEQDGGTGRKKTLF